MTEVIDGALEFLQHCSPERRTHLNNAVRRSIQVRGFRNPLQAPKPLLARKLVTRISSNPYLAYAVIGLWSDSKFDLKKKLRSSLEKRGIHRLGDIQESELPIPYLTATRDDLYRLIPELLDVDSVSQSEGALLLCCSLHRCPEDEPRIKPRHYSDEELGRELSRAFGEFKKEYEGSDAYNFCRTFDPTLPETNDDDNSPITYNCVKDLLALTDELYSSGSQKSDTGLFDDVLNLLTRSSLDSQIWFNTDAFIDAVTTLREQLSERTSVVTFIDNLHSRFADELTFLELGLPTTLPDLIDLEISRNLIEVIERLTKALESYSAARGQVASTMSAERSRLRELEQLSGQIGPLVDQICRIVAPETETETAPLEPQEESSTIRTPSVSTNGEAVSEGAAASTRNGGDPTVEAAAEQGLSHAGGVLDPRDELPSTLPKAPAVVEPVTESSSLDSPPPTQVAEDVPLSQEGENRALEDLAAAALSGRAKSWDLLVWRLVSEGRFSFAYWITLSRNEGPVPADILAALEISRAFNGESASLCNKLLELAESHHPSTEGYQPILSLAAALKPALLAPDSGMIAWLKVPSRGPFFRPLVAATLEFANRSQPFDPELLAGGSGSDVWRNELAECVSHARNWLDSSRRKRLGFVRASDVWRSFVEEGGLIATLLQPVIEDNRPQGNRIADMAQQWTRDDTLRRSIDEIDRHNVGRRLPPITGTSRKQLLRYSQEAIALAQQWSRLVRKEERLGVRQPLLARAADLRKVVESALPDIESSLAEWKETTQPLEVYAVSQVMEWTLADLRVLLRIEPFQTTPASKASLSNGIGSLLSQSLLALPAGDYDDNLIPTQEGLPALARCIAQSLAAENASAEDILEGWILKEDYRFVDELLHFHSLADSSARDRCDRGLEDSSRRLTQDLQDTLTSIEQAVVDGIIGEERSTYIATLESINVQSVRSFQKYREILQSIREELAHARTKRTDTLKQQWDELRSNPEFEGRIPAEKRTRIEGVLGELIGRNDTRLLEEWLARLTEVRDVGTDIGDSFFDSEPESDVLSDLIISINALVALKSKDFSLASIRNAIKRRQSLAGINFGSLPKERLTEVLDVIDVWKAVKHGKPAELRPDALRSILEYLGFSVDISASSIHKGIGGRDWRQFTVGMSVGDLARPIPQFGSLSRRQFDVVCFWERPGADTMRNRLTTLGVSSKSRLVIYLGRLSLRQRQDLSRGTRTEGHSALLVDEALLIFLGRERDARFPCLIRSALPFTHLNPFTPFQAGDVPPEMFFGRRAMATDLQRPTGSCLVYGGRQLGKSALLKQVERVFHKPDRQHFAWIDNLQLVFDPRSGRTTASVWIHLRDRFKEFGLISPRVRSEQPEQVMEHIAKGIESSQAMVIAMFDEADDFLDADSRDGFRVVTRLRELMLRTNRHFKVVFAGLHNVQRFQGIPNQPLAHFGSPILVGPLEPSAAHLLVKEPFECLGYRFADESVILRVLSYTNYHPGLNPAVLPRVAPNSPTTSKA